MASHPTLIVISLGGGVQSSVMALMASDGAFDTKLDSLVKTRFEEVPAI